MIVGVDVIVEYFFVLNIFVMLDFNGFFCFDIGMIIFCDFVDNLFCLWMWFDLVVNLLNFGIIVLGSELFVEIVEECSVLLLLEFLLSVIFFVMFVLLMRLVVLNVVFFVDMFFSLLKLK